MRQYRMIFLSAASVFSKSIADVLLRLCIDQFALNASPSVFESITSLGSKHVSSSCAFVPDPIHHYDMQKIDVIDRHLSVLKKDPANFKSQHLIKVDRLMC